MEPRLEQIDAANELIKGKKRMLRADCGFGKTITSLYAGKGLLEKDLIDNIIIVSPSNVTQKFLQTAKALNMKEPMVTSWAKVPKTYRGLIRYAGRYLLIVDESHKIKNCTKIRTAAVVRVARKSEYLFLLSATPTQHRPSDLYTQLKLCGAHTMSLDAYKIYFCGGFRIPGKTFVTESRPTNVEDLKKLLDKVSVIAKSERQLKLNFKMYVDRDVTIPLPSFEETAIYRKKVGLIKVKKFCDMYKDGRIVGRGIIFAHHKEVIDILRKNLKCRTIIGGMGPTKKQREINKFLKSKEEFIVISTTAGGEGIDIPGISKCFFVELTYSPMTDRQAFLRLARSPENTSIEINYFLLKDEHAYIVQKRKKEYLS